jgi:hypothetical protein
MTVRYEDVLLLMTSSRFQVCWVREQLENSPARIGGKHDSSQGTVLRLQLSLHRYSE